MKTLNTILMIFIGSGVLTLFVMWLVASQTEADGKCVIDIPDGKPMACPVEFIPVVWLEYNHLNGKKRLGYYCVCEAENK